MNLKEVAKHFTKAGVNVRPKALKSVIDHLQGINEAFRTKDMDVEMEFENDMKFSNDTVEKERNEKVIQFVIKRFEELKSYVGNQNDNFLEVPTVNQIFLNFSLKDLDLETNSKIQNSDRKDFANYIKHTEDKIMEDKNHDFEDPVFEVLWKKVLVLDTFEDLPVPRLLGKHIIYEMKKNKSLLSSAESRINYYQIRMKLLEEQILRDNRFERARLRHYENQQESSTATCLNRVNAVLGSVGKICCLGIIVTGEDGNLYLEDETMRVRLNLTQANSDQRSFFCEGNIVMVEGEYKAKAFWVDFMDHPSMIPSATHKSIASNDNFGAYTFVKNNIMTIPEEVEKLTKHSNGVDINENEAIVVISNLWLDQENNFETLLQAYESMSYISTFILCGEFISQKQVDSMDFESIKFAFDKLAESIKQYDRLKNECRFILVPGPNDPCSDQIMPNLPISEYFTSSFKGIKNVIFACNPWRISFYGKQIVVCRYNYLKKIKKNSLYLGGDIARANEQEETKDNESERIARTVLMQANLVPLSYLVQPIYWDFGESLNLNTLPDYLVLADTSAQYTMNRSEEMETTVINPGNFGCSKTFSIIYPHQGRVEENSLKPEDM